VRILIVDDEDFGRHSLQAVLRTCQHEVETAADGVQAVELATRFEPDVAIVDLLLGPPMNGDQLAVQLRQQFPNLRIIIVSGRSQIEMETVDQVGAAFLAKPFGLNELLPLLDDQTQP